MRRLPEPKFKPTPGQEIALERLQRFLRSGDRTFTLIGRGGTGKTTLVRHVVDAAVDRGSWVCGAAVSHAAKEVLGESMGQGRVFTVAALLAIKLNESTGEFEPDAWARSQGRLPIRDFDLIVIDECSMISPEMLDEILEEARSDSQIIFMGDAAQLPPIGEGEAPSPTFTVSGLHNRAELTERVRQAEDSPIVPLSDVIADNTEGVAALRALGPEDRRDRFDPAANTGVRFVREEAEAVAMLVEDLKRDPGNPRGTKAIVFNNERYRRSSQSVLNLNRTIRQGLYGKDANLQFNLGEIVVAYAPWAPSAKEPAIIHNAVSYQVEAVSEPYERPLRFRWKGKSLNESYQTVDVTLRDHGGQRVTVPVVAAEDHRRYEADLRNPNKAPGALFFRLSESFANLQYGYAITTHKAQGSTYRNVYVFEDNILGPTNPASAVTKNKSLYVAVTRASHKLVIHSRANPEQAAAAPEEPSPREQGRDILERLRREGVLKRASEL